MTEQELLQMAFDDALSRVVETDSGYQLALFTNQHSGMEGLSIIETYLTENRTTLSPEETHFLEVTVALRKVCNRREG